MDYEALLQEIHNMDDRKEFDASRTEDYESMLKECELIQAEEDHKRRDHILPKIDLLERSIRDHIQLREVCAENRSKILHEVKVAEGAYYTRPLNTDGERTRMLCEELLRVYNTIASMDSHIKFITDEELSHRASLDAYLKVCKLPLDCLILSEYVP